MFTIKGKTTDWEVVIGLETHIEVLSNSKIFSGASADYNPTVAPNTQACMVDVAMPGMLPVLNKYCVEQAIKFGLGINAEISKHSRFARKQYFYPDLPQGYQISQPINEPPVVGRGWIEIIGDDGNPKKILIERAHLEQDAGKLKHDMHPTKSFADYNRTGVTLLEIVAFVDLEKPDEKQFVTSPDEAEKCLRQIREIARALGVSKANMEEGSMRADVNVSVRPVGTKYFNERCEIKNMVSFKFIKNAIEYEAKRQIEILENGGTIERNTMRYNQGDGTTSILRSKEDALDYRYFPDPDLLELEITDEDIERIRKTMPELPSATRARYINEYGLSEYDATRLTETTDISHWYDTAVNGKKERAKPVANWLISELFAHPENMDITNEIKENSDPDAPRIITPENITELVDMILANEINGKQAKEIFIKMLDGERGTIHEIADKYGMKQITDTGAIESAVDEVIKNNPAQVEQYKSGKVGLLGFFVGNVMKATHGQANPAMVSDLLKQKLAD